MGYLRCGIRVVRMVHAGAVRGAAAFGWSTTNGLVRVVLDQPGRLEELPGRFGVLSGPGQRAAVLLAGHRDNRRGVRHIDTRHDLSEQRSSLGVPAESAVTP